jgi:hypothetical protein
MPVKRLALDWPTGLHEGLDPLIEIAQEMLESGDKSQIFSLEKITLSDIFLP